MLGDKKGQVRWPVVCALGAVAVVLLVLLGKAVLLPKQEAAPETVPPAAESAAPAAVSPAPEPAPEMDPEPAEEISPALTRGEAILRLWEAAGSPVPNSRIRLFDDVARDAAYRTAVHWAVIEGLILGAPDALFHPDAPLTRAQAVTILYRLQGEKTDKPLPFTDVEEDSYYAEAVAWAVAKGVAEGTSPTTFSPDAVCTAQELNAFLDKMDLLQERK